MKRKKKEEKTKERERERKKERKKAETERNMGVLDGGVSGSEVGDGWQRV